MSEVTETLSEGLKPGGTTEVTVGQEEVAVEPQTTQEEQVVEEVAAEPQVDLSSQFAEIARRENEIRRVQHQQKQQLEQERVKFADEIRTNPLEKLKQLGISTEEIASSILGTTTEEPSETEVLKSELAKLQAQLTEQQQAQESKRIESEIAEGRRYVSNFLKENESKFELINALGRQDDVWEAMVAVHNEFGHVDQEQVAMEVERRLEEEGKRFLGLKKFAPTPEPAKVKAKSPTLSGQQLVTTPKTEPTQRSYMSMAERDMARLQEIAKQLNSKG